MQAGLNLGMTRPITSFAQRVKQARAMRTMTQESLATAAEIAQSDVSKIERGLILKTTAIARLARALRVPVLWLEEGVGEEPDWFAEGDVGANYYRDASEPFVRGRGLAHDLSHAIPTVESTTMSWGDLMKAELPRAFTLVARDDAMAPLLRKGQIAEFSTERVAERIADLPGRDVLVADRDDNCYIRRYRLKRGTHWEAVAINDDAGLNPMDSVSDGLRVIAVMAGVKGGW
jgi:transcriptional regulator with XRE-family HTH domain